MVVVASMFMDAFKVESGIAVPPGRRPGPKDGKTAKYPWRQLDIGDSFFVETTTPRYNLAGSRSWAEKTLGIKIVQRQEGNGIRFFRVA